MVVMHLLPLGLQRVKIRGDELMFDKSKIKELEGRIERLEGIITKIGNQRKTEPMRTAKMLRGIMESPINEVRHDFKEGIAHLQRSLQDDIWRRVDSAVKGMENDVLKRSRELAKKRTEEVLERLDHWVMQKYEKIGAEDTVELLNIVHSTPKTLTS